ncbi:hypothetical protein NDU88_010071 [Pleurodeles waltl]|uniref:Uncharacterized protein n=1 Tax=Pleurodeles waltl TaxID=8319 RepID=A0AAV7RZK4_PLEWA|nr:hypothetical protein NDU88_010071 [Pleurodeles waltl]
MLRAQSGGSLPRTHVLVELIVQTGAQLGQGEDGGKDSTATTFHIEVLIMQAFAQETLDPVLASGDELLWDPDAMDLTLANP